MFAKHFAVGLIATALLSTTALAQAPAPGTKDQAPAAKVETPAKPVVNQGANEWRGSKVIGLYVYNDANERLGTINDLMMDSSGKVEKAVIGVGGFLGIGESNIAVNFEQLKFVNEPMRTATATPAAPATGPASDKGTVGTTATTPAAAPAKPSINPDHAKLSMTKEQLKDLAQFKFAE
jgi:sporulation protein YlmC with PRC-barrel domain